MANKQRPKNKYKYSVQHKKNQTMAKASCSSSAAGKQHVCVVLQGERVANKKITCDLAGVRHATFGAVGWGRRRLELGYGLWTVLLMVDPD